jgi:hypothetical protein
VPQDLRGRDRRKGHRLDLDVDAHLVGVDGPAVRGRDHGTGLGLTIAAGQTRLLGARLTFRSTTPGMRPAPAMRSRSISARTCAWPSPALLAPP